MTLVEILQQMRNNLMEHGWCQGQIRDESGRVCLVGSLSSDHDLWWYISPEMHVAVFDSLYAVIGGRCDEGPALGTWNDEEGRTFNEVLEVLDAAMLIAKNNE